MSKHSPDDNMDRLLTDFFKAQLKTPWPTAPDTAPVCEPRPAATASAQEPQTRRPAKNRDPGEKARYTLAASVAMLLGTCWYLSNGFPPAERGAPGMVNGVSAPDVLPGAGASDPSVLKELRKDNAEKGNKGIVPPTTEFKFD